jgi:hypothetical protein
MTKKQAWLVLTAGVTDIQIILEESGKKEAFQIDKGKAAKFHDWLESHQDAICFCDDRVDKSRDDLSVIEQNGQVQFSLMKQCKEFIIPVDTASISLVLPKLAGIINAVHEQYALIGAIVYYTDRQQQHRACKKVDGEPFFVAEVVARYLEKTFAELTQRVDSPARGGICLVNYLDEDCQYDGSGDEYPIKFSVAEKLESPIRHCRLIEPKAELILSDMGGVPAVKSVLKAAAALHFDGRNLLWTQSEAGGKDHLVQPTRTSHELSLRTRTECVRLLKMGAIEEAYGMTRDYKDQSWVRAVSDLHDLFSGVSEYTPQNLPNYLNKLAVFNGLGFIPRCFVHAIRGQAALRTGNFINASASTYGIFEAARLDALDKWLVTNRQPRIQDVTQAFNPSSNHFIRQNQQQNVSFREVTPEKNGIISYKLGETYINRDDPLTKEFALWLNLIDTPDKILNSAMSAYSQAIRQEIDVSIEGHAYLKRLSPKKLRNTLTHGFPPKPVVVKLPELFTGVGLWQKQSEYTQILWPNSPASNILAFFDCSNPEQIYDHLIQSVCEVLLTYRPVSTEQ